MKKDKKSKKDKKEKKLKRIEQSKLEAAKKLQNYSINAKQLRRKLTAFFSRTVFIVFLSAVGIAGLTVFILSRTKVFETLGETGDIGLVIIFIVTVAFVCLLCFITSIIIGNVPLKPINDLINSMNRLASGDFKTRLQFGKTVANHKTFKGISESFNKLAEELENTETLRSDFINNFSHEFKTPIVSIAGLAKLVNKGNLSEEQKKQYLTAIEEESMRLASMATNVLNLTKIENQSILTNVSSFNLSEQIRASVLLLENKWSRKEIELSIDFDEYYIEANEELLKQVWINLIDNAVKFSPIGGTVKIYIHSENDILTVSIQNSAPDISKENQDKIWNKFYQADESHASEGNGVGLAIVKKIVELHKGQASLISENETVTFNISLLAKQSV